MALAGRRGVAYNPCMTSLSLLIAGLSLLPGFAAAAQPTVEQAEAIVVEAIQGAPKNAVWAAHTPVGEGAYETIWLLAAYAKHEDWGDGSEENSPYRAVQLKSEYWKGVVAVLDAVSQDAVLAGTNAPGGPALDLAQEQERLARAVRLARLGDAARLIVADIEADRVVVGGAGFKPGEISGRRLALFRRLAAVAP